MRNDTLTALLLDPFLTFGEAAKEVGAMTPDAPSPRPDSLKPPAVSGSPRVDRRTVRVQPRGVPVIHHLPATAG
jgi:hypothetical protein